VELTLEDMQQQGHGAAPRAFALLIMGSGGRREMMLDPDQDNGLIIEDAAGPLSAGETRWFARFAGALNDNFATVGYRLCPGDIMARNPTYHKTLGEWQAQIHHLLRHPSEKAARWSNIVFDFDTLYGDDGLTSALRKTLLTSLQQENKLLAFMAEDDAEGQPAIGWFNRLITADDKNRKGRIDIKRNGSRIICDAARIFALSAGVTSCNTYDRLNSLVHQGTLSADLVDSVITAYDELMDLLLSHQLDCDERGQPIDNLIDPDTLSGQAKEALRMAMRAIKRLQDILQGRFGLSNF
jgi:CBS domain-containing protein